LLALLAQQAPGETMHQTTTAKVARQRCATQTTVSLTMLACLALQEPPTLPTTTHRKQTLGAISHIAEQTSTSLTTFVLLAMLATTMTLATRRLTDQLHAIQSAAPRTSTSMPMAFANIVHQARQT